MSLELGLSRSLRYRRVPLGRGTCTVVVVKSAGMFAVFAAENAGSLEMESTR